MHHPPVAAAAAEATQAHFAVDTAADAALFRRLGWRLVPFLFLCYVVACLDRVNLGFAKLQMLADLQWSDTVYGLGAGVFFLGYLLFDVPSNIMVHRVGARWWIARILVTRGLLSSALMTVQTPEGFYALRFALGVAEAGLFPGILLYLTQWFPARRRAGVVALFMTAIAVAGVLSGPLSGAVLQGLDGVHGWAGWQWLFLLGGLPSVLVGLAVPLCLSDRPQQARWLGPAERQRLAVALHDGPGGVPEMGLAQVFRHGPVWQLAAIYFCFILGLYGVAFWMPQLMGAAGVRDLLQLGLLSAVPYGLAAVAMVAASRSSDRRGERRWHTAGAGLVGAVGLVLCAFTPASPALALLATSVATVGCLATLPLFWTLPTTLLRGQAAAAALGLVNAVGNLAGFVSPFVVGAVRDATGSVSAGLLLLAAVQALGSSLVLWAGRAPRSGR